MPSFRRSFPRFALSLAIALPIAALAGETLRVLAWPGYADPDVVKAFEKRTGSTVELTLIASDDALWKQINGNHAQDFDVFAVNTAELQGYIRAALVAPG